MQRHASESADSRRIQDADHLVRGFRGEVLRKDRGSVRQPSQLEQLPPAAGLEHGESPALPIPLSSGNVRRCQLE